MGRVGKIGHDKTEQGRAGQYRTGRGKTDYSRRLSSIDEIQQEIRGGKANNKSKDKGKIGEGEKGESLRAHAEEVNKEKN